MSITQMIIAFLSVFGTCISSLLTNLNNSHGILGFVRNTFELINPSNYQAVLDWALIEVPVTSTMYAPQGLIVLMLFLVIDRLLITPVMREVLRTIRYARRLLPIIRTRIQTTVNDGIAFVQLTVEEIVRCAKLIPSKVKTIVKKHMDITKQNLSDAKEDIIEFGKAIKVFLKVCYTIMKFVWRVVKTLAVCIKTGMKDFAQTYHNYQMQEEINAKAKSARKAKRAQEKAKKAFQRKGVYNITPRNSIGIYHSDKNNDRKVI